MPIPVVHAIDVGGKELGSKVLAPLFATLAPGFEARAEELRVQVTSKEGHDFHILCSYMIDGAMFPLSIAAGYHPSIASSRIRIVCGMSIMPDIPHQEGSMTVRFGERTISVRVQVTAEDGTEIMKFQPMWDRSSQPNASCEN